MIERYTINTESKFEFDGKYWNGTGTVVVKVFDTKWDITNIDIPQVTGRTLEEAQNNLITATEKVTGADKLKMQLQKIDDAMLLSNAPLVG